MTKTAIIVPCFNEASRIPLTAFVQFICANPNVNFYFIDDGSTDSTSTTIAAGLKGLESNFTLITLAKNQGKAEAVRQGLLQVVSKNSYNYIGYWDADLSTPLSSILSFLQVLEDRTDISIVIGSRVKLAGRYIERNPKRHYLGRIAATLISLASSFTIYDTQCGAKIFRNFHAFRTILQQPFLSKWLFDVELLWRWDHLLCNQNRTIPSVNTGLYEYPLEVWKDVANSKVRWNHYLSSLFDLIRIVLQTHLTKK